ncbi:MAG: family 1 glycosylhydrolase [Armatimonadota bacterium]
MDYTANIHSPKATPLELWGGIECTVNRIGDTFVDQFDVSGHPVRRSDLDRIASLGIRTLRYPVTWERLAPDGCLQNADWSWIDDYMAHLRQLQIQPIVGLVHHGSGPRHTSLLDPDFPGKLAEFAGAVARRYPWVTKFTPVNEPLTTARFSGLYGHWYPHGTDEQTFAHCLMTEIKATILAMRAIREVTPSAQLVQTEDMGKTHSTPALAYQAEFENERRWITYDLLCGRVGDWSHRMRGHFSSLGVPEQDLDFFVENPCPPDIIGINHYVTSERFLDERIHNYPEHTHGSNGKHQYADVEAVRSMKEGPSGVASLLRETWDRYKLPIAVTEAHLGCTREEQLRWLVDVWKQATKVREDGADIRAVTAWSLFGAFDWDSLLTKPRGNYESGVFDLRGIPEPRETALAPLCRELAAGKLPSHPVLDSPGWWRRPERCLIYASGSHSVDDTSRSREPICLVREGALFAAQRDARPLLITGGQGSLAEALVRLCDERGLTCRVTNRVELDIASIKSINSALERYNPWAVINAAGFSSIKAAETETFRCFRENTKGPALLADACQRRDIPLVLFSSAHVFDGRKSPEPYTESDATNPGSVYGRSKATMEKLVMDRMPEKTLIVRGGAFFSPWDSTNFLTRALRQLAQGLPVSVSEDTLTLAYLPDLGHAVLDLLVDGAAGVWHLGHPEEARRIEIVQQAADLAGLDSKLLWPARWENDSGNLIRPAWAVLESERTKPLLPPLRSALRHFVASSSDQWQRSANELTLHSQEAPHARVAA